MVSPLERCVSACIFALLLSGCWVEPQKVDVQRVIEDAGFTKVHDIKPVFFGCDQQDAFRYEFFATAPNGRQVQGFACSSWFKGWTVRQK